MQCPICYAPSTVLKTPPDRATSPRVIRRRVCTGATPHRFSSIEHAEAFSLEQVAIRRNGSGDLSPFDKDLLLREVKVGVSGVLSEAEIYIVINGVTAQLQAQLPDIAQWYMPEAPQSGRRTPEAMAYIEDFELRDIVEYQLKQAHNRIAHFLYAVAIRGRRDRDGREGWKQGAADVLKWVFKEYTDLETGMPTPVITPRRVEWHPVPPPIYPRYVLKSGRIVVGESKVKPESKTEAIVSETQDQGRDTEDRWVVMQEQSGRLVEFNRLRFIKGIKHALLGHREKEKFSHWIAWWVLYGLAGQERVTSSQLSAGVLDCLRRVDDLAYLRWAARMKSIPQVKGLRDEALALIKYPSDRLIFLPRAVDSEQPPSATSTSPSLP